MNAFVTISKFWKDDSGAVTVDWVVITAAVVGLSLLLMVFFAEALFGATGVFSTSLEGAMTTAAGVN